MTKISYTKKIKDTISEVKGGLSLFIIFIYGSNGRDEKKFETF